MDTTVQYIPVKVGPRFEERPLHCLSSQMKQGLATRVQTSIKALATKKRKGEKVSRLRFKRSLRAIPLKQYGITYRVTNGGNRVKIQRVPGSLRVRGFDQIPSGAELANAVFLKKASGYYLKMTVYTPRNEDLPPPDRSIGVDLGLTYQMAFSNGVLIEYRVPVSQCKKLRRLYRWFSRKQKGSKNQAEALRRLQKEFEHLTNRKRDTVNKLVGFLAREYLIVGFQDENLSAWQRLWGAKLLDTGLSTFLSAVKKRVLLPSEVPRMFPSTQLCSTPECAYRGRKGLANRIHHCPVCGLELDRDVNAARNIEAEGVRLVSTPENLGAERCRSHARGDLPSTLTDRMVAYYQTIPGVRARQVAEAGNHLQSGTWPWSGG